MSCSMPHLSVRRSRREGARVAGKHGSGLVDQRLRGLPETMSWLGGGDVSPAHALKHATTATLPSCEVTPLMLPWSALFALALTLGAGRWNTRHDRCGHPRLCTGPCHAPSQTQNRPHTCARHSREGEVYMQATPRRILSPQVKSAKLNHPGTTTDHSRGCSTPMAPIMAAYRPENNTSALQHYTLPQRDHPPISQLGVPDATASKCAKAHHSNVVRDVELHQAFVPACMLGSWYKKTRSSMNISGLQVEPESELASQRVSPQPMYMAAQVDPRRTWKRRHTRSFATSGDSL